MSDTTRDFERLLTAFVDGDHIALERQLGGCEGFPNVVAHPALGLCLVQAIYSSPLDLVRWLLAHGADPNIDPHDGFPPLIAAIACADRTPGAPSRDDVGDLVAVLLAAGVDVDQRGPNGDTAVRVAAAGGHTDLVEQLLAAGADPDATG